MTTLHSTRGANYWSDLPITRIDLTIGAYENISSSDVPDGFGEGEEEGRVERQNGGAFIRPANGHVPRHEECRNADDVAHRDEQTTESTSLHVVGDPHSDHEHGQREEVVPLAAVEHGAADRGASGVLAAGEHPRLLQQPAARDECEAERCHRQEQSADAKRRKTDQQRRTRRGDSGVQEREREVPGSARDLERDDCADRSDRELSEAELPAKTGDDADR